MRTVLTADHERFRDQVRRFVAEHIVPWHANWEKAGVVAPYLLAYAQEERKRRWLPRMARGEMIGALAMTEPGIGSDLKAVRTTARRDGDSYIINGQKTFITNG